MNTNINFGHISLSFLRMKNFLDKRCMENQNTHFMFNNFFPKIMPFMRQCGKNVVERGRLQMATYRMRIPCWIHKATNTHSDCVTRIAFPLQQWLHEIASVLLYMYFDILFSFFCREEARSHCAYTTNDKIV